MNEFFNDLIDIKPEKTYLQLANVSSSIITLAVKEQVRERQFLKLEETRLGSERRHSLIDLWNYFCLIQGYLVFLKVVGGKRIEELYVLLSLFSVEFIKLLPHLIFPDFHGQVMFDFLHEVSRVQQSQCNMILIKSFQVKFLEHLLASFDSFFESVDHFLVVASTLYFVSRVNELTHLHVEALSLAHVGE